MWIWWCAVCLFPYCHSHWCTRYFFVVSHLQTFYFTLQQLFMALYTFMYEITQRKCFLSFLSTGTFIIFLPKWCSTKTQLYGRDTQHVTATTNNFIWKTVRGIYILFPTCRCTYHCQGQLSGLAGSLDISKEGRLHVVQNNRSLAYASAMAHCTKARMVHWVCFLLQ